MTGRHALTHGFDNAKTYGNGVVTAIGNEGGRSLAQPQQLSRTIEALEQRRIDLLRGLSEDQKRAMEELPDPCGDWADNASLLAETYIHSLIMERRGVELRRIDALLTEQNALQRTCEECAGPIPLARLSALPTATTCIDCQERIEAEEARQRALLCAARTDPYE